MSWERPFRYRSAETGVLGPGFGVQDVTGRKRPISLRSPPRSPNEQFPSCLPDIGGVMGDLMSPIPIGWTDDEVYRMRRMLFFVLDS